jgi:hypothetical protein
VNQDEREYLAAELAREIARLEDSAQKAEDNGNDWRAELNWAAARRLTAQLEQLTNANQANY